MQTASLAPMECPATAAEMSGSADQNLLSPIRSGSRASLLAMLAIALLALLSACSSDSETRRGNQARSQRPRTDHRAISVSEAVCRGARLEPGREALPPGVDGDQRRQRSGWQVGRLARRLRLGTQRVTQNPTPGRAARPTAHLRAASIPGSKTVTARRTPPRRCSTWRS